MMTIDQVRELDRRSDPTKLLPTTLDFLREMREVTNSGRARRDEPSLPWTPADEARD